MQNNNCRSHTKRLHDIFIQNHVFVFVTTIVYWRIEQQSLKTMRARRIQETIQTYLVSIGTVYLFAFVSLYVQVPGKWNWVILGGVAVYPKSKLFYFLTVGLYGRNGILPIDRVIPKLEGIINKNGWLYDYL